MQEDERADIEDVTNRLSDQLDDAVPRATISARVRRSFNTFRHARVAQFIPVFVERRVRNEFRR
jgi:hypothetical protein